MIISDILTREQVEAAWGLWLECPPLFHRHVVDHVLRPGMKLTNLRAGQVCDPEALAHAIEHAFRLEGRAFIVESRRPR